MNELGKMNTAQVAESLIAPVLDEKGLILWDVKFEKEGSDWYLRYFIDKDGGVNIKDCEEVNHAISKILDEADPIPHSYILEVGSPGIERQLTRDWHFEWCAGMAVTVKLIRPVEGVREFTGELVGIEGDEVTILLDEDTEMTFTKKESAYIKLYADFETGGLKG